MKKILMFVIILLIPTAHSFPLILHCPHMHHDGTWFGLFGGFVYRLMIGHVGCNPLHLYNMQQLSHMISFMDVHTVLLCPVCLFDLGCFFLSSLIKNMYYIHVCT